LVDKPNPMPGEITASLAQANRVQFSAAVPSFGASRDTVLSLERRLAQTSAERTQLQAEIDAVRASTSWRLTRPLRWAMETLGPKRQPPPVAPPPLPPAAAPIPTYDDWIAQSEAATVAALLRFSRGGMPVPPRRVGVVQVRDAGPASEAMPVQILAVPAESEQAPAELVAASLAQLDADLVCFLPSHCRLSRDALALVTALAANDPAWDIIFGDEDWQEGIWEGGDGRRTRPFFKPGWSPTLQRERDLLGPCAFLRTSLVAAATIASGPAWRHDLANQVAAMTRPERIGHIPAVLCHRSAPPEGYDSAIRAASQAQLARDGVRGRVEPATGETNRVRYGLPDPAPLVSVIIPTRDRADLLGPCMDGLLNGTGYPRLEVLIVDNGTVDPDAIALLDRLSADARVRVLRDVAPFNWAVLNNGAARHAAGDVLLLLNNDIAMLQRDWLSELVGQVMQPGVGAAGGKLLYPDGRIQHAGVTTDLRGFPRHLLRYAAGDDPGPFGLLGSARDVWGVTGACLAIRREVFFAVGGLNEVFALSYNDVDLCLRLTAAGYRIVWTPWSVLEHRELASRPPDHSPSRRDAADAELRRLQADWGAFVQSDSYLHPALELVDERPCFRLADPR
jgi:GT2 family glycosyltransferase